MGEGGFSFTDWVQALVAGEGRAVASLLMLLGALAAGALALRVMAFEAVYFQPEADRRGGAQPSELPEWLRPLQRTAVAVQVAVLGLWLAALLLALGAWQRLGADLRALLWLVPLLVVLLVLLALRTARVAERRPGPALTFGAGVLRLLAPLLYLPTRALAPLYRRLTEAPTPDQRAVELEGLAQTIDETPEVDSPVEEKALLKSLITLNQVPVRSVMCPRAQMRTLTTSMSLPEVLRHVRHEGYSRYPVTDASGKTVRGILVAKDLLPLVGTAELDWRRLLRTPYFVAETKRVPQLLSEFKQRRIHLAIVISEGGAVAGLVTLQDILEEIFGELKDEFDGPAAAPTAAAS